MEFENLVEESKVLLDFAASELKIAKEREDELMARQAAEKAYLALTKAFNAFFLKKGKREEELPKSDRGRRYFLHSIAGKELENFYDTLRSRLHIDAFHEGIVIFNSIEEDLKEIKKFILDLKNGKI